MNDQQRNQRWVNDPAFPQGISSFHQIENLSKGISEIKGGLTKRELLAAMAMQGIRAADAGTSAYTESSTVAKLAVEDADALLKELRK